MPSAPPNLESDIDLWPQVLVVDDDTSILKLIETVLTSKGIAPTTVTTIAQAQAALDKNHSFAVILCDHLLPDGLGVEFLRDQRIAHPMLVRVLMTGLYDKTLAMDAINSGEIFRFLVKPFTVEDLLATISHAFDRYNLASENAKLQAQLALQNEELRRANADLGEWVTREHALAENLKTESTHWQEASRGMIDLCLEILQRIDPILFKHSQRVSILATAIGRELRCDAETLSKLEIAAQLHDIGLLGCNQELRSNQRTPQHIANRYQREQIEAHTTLSAELVKFLPLPDVLEAIEQHHEYLDGSGYPKRLAGARLSLLTQILSVADSYDEAPNADHILSKMIQAAGRLYASEPIYALERAVSKGLNILRERQMLLHELVPGMRLSNSIYTATGMLLVKQGQVLSKSMIDLLLQHSESNAITQKILVEA